MSNAELNRMELELLALLDFGVMVNYWPVGELGSATVRRDMLNFSPDEKEKQPEVMPALQQTAGSVERGSHPGAGSVVAQ